MKNITLEMTLKPFRETTQEYIEKVCNEIFKSWEKLLNRAESASVMLWTGDGSELLDYRGSLKDEFEWGYKISDANDIPRTDKMPGVDPDCITLYSRGYKYMENPPVMTYEILKNIVNTIKKSAKRYIGDKPIYIGTTFDPGPEFAKSSFKYERHNEICTGIAANRAVMVCAYEKLNGDNVKYASYPNGIPNGTPFGTFFGKQANVFIKDVGFDFIWFSNGFGFGRDTWQTTGAVFDGEKFDAGAAPEVKQLVSEFWKLFRKECSYPIATRGTNLSMAIDLASDGVPLKEIYESVDDLLPPPNSPWAALDGDYGLELMGYMSRIAKIPDQKYLFRYYLHDPWWLNSPWYDRYNGQPHDIYLPLAVSRIDENGNIQNPSNMSILSIDNSFGNMPEACVVEPLPHFLKAIKEMPDEPAPFVWIYPFDEYSGSKKEQEFNEMFSEDWYIRNSINNGLPLSMVTSTDSFLNHNKSMYSASVIITPVPEAESFFENEIIDYVQKGGKVIFYGNTFLAGDKFKDFWGIEHGEEVSGELEMNIDGQYVGIVKHEPIVCGGGIYEKKVKADVFAIAAGRPVGAKYLNSVWLRATVSSEYKKDNVLLLPHDENRYFISEKLILKALEIFGYYISYKKIYTEKNPVAMIHRYNNAFIYSSFQPSTTVRTKMKFPYGAPLLDGYETVLENGFSTYNFPKSEHREMRVFVEQKSGIVGCREVSPESWQYRRKIEVNGLKNATVRFLAESYCKNNITVTLNPYVHLCTEGEEFEGEYVEIDGLTFFEVRNVTGRLWFWMPFDK